MKKSKTSLTIYTVDTETDMSLPFVGGIKAGFPSPAQDYIESSIDLNKELIKHPSATFFARVTGDSLKDAGLDIGDIILVDRSLSYDDGTMVVCFIDGDFTVKYINLKDKDRDVIWLHSVNEKYQPIKVTPENQFLIWGRVINIIKSPVKLSF